MTKEKGPAVAGPGARRAPSRGTQTAYHSLPNCQNPIRTLRDLAEDAGLRAEVAGLLADTYQAAGDVACWRLWRRRHLAHQAIRRAALLQGVGCDC